MSDAEALFWLSRFARVDLLPRHPIDAKSSAGPDPLAFRRDVAPDRHERTVGRFHHAGIGCLNRPLAAGRECHEGPWARSSATVVLTDSGYEREAEGILGVVP